MARRGTIERLEAELLELKVRYEDLWQERQKAVRDLLQLESLQEDEVRHIRAELKDEATSREGMDRRLADLRVEVNLCIELGLNDTSYYCNQY